MYKIQHIATNLFFQPYKARKSSLSIKGGKIYQTAFNCLNTNMRDGGFNIYCHRGSNIHLITKDILDWKSINSVYKDKLECWTDIKDWRLFTL